MYRIYTTKYINIISLIASVIIFSLVCIINIQIRDNNFLNPSISNLGNNKIVKVQFAGDIDNKTEEENVGSNNIKNNDVKNSIKNNVSSNVIEKNKTREKINWCLEIPRIFLEAEIAEGTSAEILNSKIGHFEETSKSTGNVCLAAHNRGYPVNYFENLKLLKIGDLIKYKYDKFEKEYVITENSIIKDTDVECLEETKENVITLITCIENEPEYRRCVRGVEK